LAAVVLTSDGIQDRGVVGVRKRGTRVPATLDDLWHLGSDTKAMTATLIARLVERDELEWSTTMEAVFPDLLNELHPNMRGVTVEQLLAHRAGLPPNLDLRRYAGDDVRALRLQAVREYLAERPIYPPGSQMEYSNLGYIIAGAVVEQVLNKTWEEAMREEVFTPLGMDSAGFGGTGTPGQIDQPWPHGNKGEPMPLNGPAIDNPPVMGPAGRVHCTIQDWAKFVQDQLRGARGEGGTLLKPESYIKLHTPPSGGDYALGWAVTERGWGGGTVLHHSGDNTMNHANVWIAPNRDFALLACANQGGDEAFKATDAAVGAMIQMIEGGNDNP
jgi:CubicO group peptidase (beta-lactamase class C family)